MTSLRTALFENDLARVKCLIDNGADVNEKIGDSIPTTPLYEAARGGHLEMLQLLVDNGANVNKQGEFGNALQAAAGRGSLETVRFLVDLGADVNQQCGYYGSALQAAAGSESLETVRFLVNLDAGINQQGGYYGNALQAAAANGSLEIVRFLVNNGANLNQQGGYYGNALQAAVGSGSLETVGFLIDQGANVNQQGGYYGNALHAAAKLRNLEMVKLLVDRDADVCIQDMFQMTALHYAVQRSAADIVEFLVGRNAHPEAKNDTGATSFDLAIHNADGTIIRLLLPKMEPPPLLSAKRWRKALHLEDAGPLIFTFQGHLSIEPAEDSKSLYMRFFRLQFDGNRLIDGARDYFIASVPSDPVQIVLNNGMLEGISPPSTFGSRWWRRRRPNVGINGRWSLETSPLPSTDLCRQLAPRNLFIESWFTISCLTITNANWPSHQPDNYDHLKQVEGFFWVTAVPHKSDFTHERPIEEFLRPILSVTTCEDTPVKSIRGIDDLIAPLIDKLDHTFEENNLQASHQLSNARLEVLKNGGRNEPLLHRLLSDATVIEYMTENHAHIVRSLTKLIDDVAGLQNGPWKLSEGARKNGKERIESFKAHRETLIELREKSQNIIQLEFNLASILEARRSTSTNRSMKRLTWVTFVYLPLLFVASLFGMNVDILSKNPSWWWYFPIAGGFVLLTFGVWIIFKRFHTLEGSLERYFAWLVSDEIRTDGKQPTSRRDGQTDSKKLKVRRRIKQNESNNV
ncbi:ankyrin repeat-containing domain protein [Nemania abortiva]|nr:ankyrin repeat-containing domain protein [Nemania abortiva]